MANIRLRFAPSPTGYLHIGGLRQALFNYFIVKHLDGKMIFRLEDTDRKREVLGAAFHLTKVLADVGIKFDEGPAIGGDYGPYIQSERQENYHKYLPKLLAEDKVYCCFCTPERLDEMRAQQTKDKLPPRYDRTCRDLSPDEVRERLDRGDTYVIRQKMPIDGEITVHDEVRGDITFKCENLDDHVLIKADSTPTYQYANVVDDHEMEISHVLRGDEWLSSFPKNILLYQAFGWTPPKYIHAPLILNKEGGKLSKRQGDVSVEDFLAKGYLPEALINFCGLMGWHPKDDNEILSMDDFCRLFEIKDISISPAIFDLDKLDFFNGYYIRQKGIEELTESCLPHLVMADSIERHGEGKYKLVSTGEEVSYEYLKGVVGLAQERMKKLSEVAELSDFFFFEINYAPEMLVWKKSTVENAKAALEKIHELLDKIPAKEWVRHAIKDEIMTYLAAKELKTGEYLWPLRVALTGKEASPGPFEVAEVLGKEKSLARLQQAIRKLS